MSAYLKCRITFVAADEKANAIAARVGDCKREVDGKAASRSASHATQITIGEPGAILQDNKEVLLRYYCSSQSQQQRGKHEDLLCTHLDCLAKP